MNKIKLIALDLDGTALTPQNKVAETTTDAVRRAREAGVYVAVSTGRICGEARDFAVDLDADDLMVTSGGATLSSISGEGCTMRMSMPWEAAVRAAAAVERIGMIAMMNRMRLDRRAVACALAFGHKVPYITIPFGFGLIFQRVIADNLTENGLSVTVRDVTAANWSIGVAMLLGLLIAVFVLYRRPREYCDLEADTSASEEISEKLEYRHYVMLGAAIVVAVVQVISQDLALSALCGLVVIVVFRAIKWNEIDAQVEGGIRLMGQIAIIMLVAGGYASVIKATGGIDALVNAGISAIGGSRPVAAVVITLIGLLVTMGIGTSFGTVPVLAVLFVPMCASLGFSTPATILLISAAAALGDAGSPASDTTLGPTSGLNADGQHDHIRDTCIPTFIAFNIPIMLCAILMSQVL